MNLDGEIKVDWGIFNLQDQNFPDCVLDRHNSLIVHVLFELKVYEKLGICLTVHKILGDDVIWPIGKILIGYCFHLQSEVKIG